MFSSKGFNRSRPASRHKQRRALPKFKQIRFADKRFYGLMTICAVLIFTWQFVKPELNDFTPVENVRIESTFENIPLSELRQQVMSVLSGGYFTVDIDAIRNSLLDLPWVENVSVRRQWPSGLHIRVIEKQAVAFWGRESLLSDRGELFTPVSVDRDQSLPQLDGPEGYHQKVWAFLLKINRDIKPMDVEVKRLVLDERRAWRFNISNNSSLKNIEIRLGRADIDHRLTRFVRIFSNKITKLGNIGFVDLRYPNGFAMSQKISKKNSVETTMKSLEIENRSTGAVHARKRGVIT